MDRWSRRQGVQGVGIAGLGLWVAWVLVNNSPDWGIDALQMHE